MTDVDEMLGKILGGRFRLLRRLGQGGMGAVYEAEDIELPVKVALKVIKPNLVDDKDAIQRFQREARAVGGLQHPHIVGFVGAGEDAGVHWLAMELLEGIDLKERLAARGAIPWKETLPLLREILFGLIAAHERGVIHRDLKPENVMLVGKPGAVPVVKLLDFGIAKQIDVEGMTMTGTGIVVGTPGFVAPEVIVHGVTNDPRSDLYSVGVVWFEMLTATKPFDAPTPFALAMRHVQEAPPRPTSLLPFSPVPPPVEELVLRLMAKRPTDRPASAKELLTLVDDLERQAAQPIEPANSRRRTESDHKTETDMMLMPGGAHTPPASSDTFRDLPVTESEILSRPEPEQEQKKKTKRPLFAAAAAGLLVVLVLLALSGKDRRARRREKMLERERPVLVDAGVSDPTPIGATITPPAVVDAGVVVEEPKRPKREPRRPDRYVPDLDLTP